MFALLLENPFARTGLCWAFAYLVVAATDRYAMPAAVVRQHRPEAGIGGRLVDALARIPSLLLIFAIFFAISWRPLYSFAGTVSFFVIFTGISRAKFDFIREPLLFSDIALVLDVFKHKEIFYAGWLNVAFWIGTVTYVFGASALFMIFEPATLPASHPAVWIATAVALPLASGLLLFDARYRWQWSRFAAWLFATDDIRRLTVRLGTFTAVMYHFLMWLGRERSVPAPLDSTRSPALIKSPPSNPQAAGGKPLVVVWQSESFIDMRHFGVSRLALPNLDRLRRRSVEWGRLLSVFEGGYTLRTEFSVLSGLRPEDIGADAFHPYLRAGAYSEIAWPSLFRRAGWSTHFIHPYDGHFFARHRALPQLGFDTLTMLDGFDHDVARDGRYVSDMALSRRVLSACGDSDEAQFVFAASMENHGPWLPGRCGSRKTPLDIYLGILERSDAALGHLADRLDRMARPVWLVFYGDHAPILKSFADPFPDSRTDYMMVPLGTAAGARRDPTPTSEKGPWNLIGDLVGSLSFQSALAAVAPQAGRIAGHRA